MPVAVQIERIADPTLDRAIRRIDRTLRSLEITPGVSMRWYGGTADADLPSGWIRVNGGRVSIERYRRLYNVVGHRYRLSETDINLAFFRLPPEIANETWIIKT